MMSEETESLRAEVVGLRSALTTVTEALILFQEFIEVEIGEMSYFRDSGSYYKLVEIFNKLRTDTLIAVTPNVTTVAKIGNQQGTNNIDKRLSFNMTREDKRPVVDAEEDEEQIEVQYDEDSTDEISTDEITISKVYSVSPPPETVVTSDSPESPTPLAFVTTVFSPEKKDAHEIRPQYWMSRPVAPLNTWGDGINAPHLVNPGRPNSSLENGNAQYFQEGPLNLVVTASSATGAQTSGNAPSAIPRTRNPRGRGRPKGIDKLAKKLASEAVAPAASAPKKERKRRRSDCPVLCPECLKGYSSKGVLSRHIKEAHQSEPQFICFHCPLKFRNGPSRLEHMHEAHPNDFNSVVCPYCNKEASTATGKRNHMMMCPLKYTKPRDRSRRKKRA